MVSKYFDVLCDGYVLIMSLHVISLFWEIKSSVTMTPAAQDNLFSYIIIKIRQG